MITFPGNTRCQFCGYRYAIGADHSCPQGMEFAAFVHGKTIERVVEDSSEPSGERWIVVHFTDGSQWQFAKPSEGFVMVEAQTQ